MSPPKRPTDHAGLAALARALADHRDSTGCDTRDLRGVPGVVYLTIFDGAVAADHTGTVASTRGSTPNTALRGLADALDRLAAQHPPAPCTPSAPTDRLCDRVAEASRAIVTRLDRISEGAAASRRPLTGGKPLAFALGGRIGAGTHHVDLMLRGAVLSGQEEWQATAHLSDGMTFAAAVGITAEEALTRLRNILAQEATR
jgi:hypothetical protein